MLDFQFNCGIPDWDPIVCAAFWIFLWDTLWKRNREIKTLSRSSLMKPFDQINVCVQTRFNKMLYKYIVNSDAICILTGNIISFDKICLTLSAHSSYGNIYVVKSDHSTFSVRFSQDNIIKIKKIK